MLVPQDIRSAVYYMGTQVRHSVRDAHATDGPWLIAHPVVLLTSRQKVALQGDWRSDWADLGDTAQ